MCTQRLVDINVIQGSVIFFNCQGRGVFFFLQVWDKVSFPQILRKGSVIPLKKKKKCGGCEQGFKI